MRPKVAQKRCRESPVVDLDLSSVDVYGRNDELLTLKRALHDVQRGPTQTVFIEGASGSGKSTLVQAFLDSLGKEPPIFCGRGKFDEGQMATEPLCAIETAITELVADVAKDSATMNRILNSMEADWEILETAFPKLERLIATTASNNIPTMRRTSEILVSRASITQVHGSRMDAKVNGRQRRVSNVDIRNSMTQQHRRTSKVVLGVVDTGRLDNDNSKEKRKRAEVRSSVTPRRISRLDMARVVNETPNRRRSSELSNYSGEGQLTFRRLHAGLRTLLRIIAAERPCILFLDDIQWADEEALEILETLFEDTQRNRSVLFIACHRPVEASHDIVGMKCEVDPRQRVEIILNSLNTESLSSLLSDILHCEMEDVNALAEIVQQKTDGNPFFVIQYLMNLVESGLLSYSMASCKWTWDKDRILVETDVSDNILAVVGAKIRTIPMQVRLALTTSACLGTPNFLVSNLCDILNNAKDANERFKQAFPDEFDRHDLYLLLDEAASHGFLERVTHNEFKFAHERIREGALSLISTDDKTLLHLVIGRTFHQIVVAETTTTTTTTTTMYLTNAAGPLYLQAAAHFNLARDLIVSEEERLSVAELNYVAAEVATERLSFYPAAEFLRSGIDLLGPQAWKDHFSLRLSLGAALTRMEFCCGHLTKSMELADDVLLHARKFDDKRDAYHTKIMCLSFLGQQAKAQTVVVSVLRELGFDLPPYKTFLSLHVLRELARTRRLLQDRSDEELRNLPEAAAVAVGDVDDDDNDDDDEPTTTTRTTTTTTAATTTAPPRRCTDDILEFILRLSGLVSHGSSQADQNLLTTCLLRGMQLTLLHGRSQKTANTFLSYSAILAKRGDLKEAFRYGLLGMHFAKQPNDLCCCSNNTNNNNNNGGVGVAGVSLDPSAKMNFYAWCLHLRRPYRDGVEPSATSLQELWNVGDVEQVLTHTRTYLGLYYCSGLRLEPLLTDIDRYVDMLKDYGHWTLYDNNVAFFQMISLLMGQSQRHRSSINNNNSSNNNNNKTELSGAYMDQKDSLQKWLADKNTNAIQSFYLYRMMFAYIMSDYEVAHEMSIQISSSSSSTSSSLSPSSWDMWVNYRKFFQGLSALTLYQQSGRLRHWRRGVAIIKEFCDLIRQGVACCYHMFLVLKAERMAGSPRKYRVEKVQDAFDQAIAASGKLGVLHDQAIACERAGAYFCSRKDASWSASYLVRAKDLYREWGALGKVRQMDVLYGDKMGSSSFTMNSVTVAGSVQSRSRLDMSTERHHSLELGERYGSVELLGEM